MTAIITDNAVTILPEDCGITIFRIWRKMTNKNAEQLTSISPACHFPLYVKLTKTTAITKKAIQVYTIALSNLPCEGMELSAFFLDFPIKALKNCIRIFNH